MPRVIKLLIKMTSKVVKHRVAQLRSKKLAITEKKKVFILGDSMVEFIKDISVILDLKFQRGVRISRAF